MHSRAESIPLILDVCLRLAARVPLDAPFLKTHEAILLSNHGAVTYAASLEEAFLTMEKVEQIAHMTFVARSLGGAVTLTPEERERLAAAGEKNYGKNIRKTAP